MEKPAYPSVVELADQRQRRAAAIAQAGGIEVALESGALERYLDITVSEALVLGLLRQGVSRFFAVFGHGSTEVAEVLRIYSEAGLVRVMPVRSEIEASHAAAALRWVTGEKAGVITSIGPGALQALAASLAPASNGLGIWYLLGDETSEDEGFNMQQVPKHRQGLFLTMFGALGEAYSLHTPGAVGTALKRGFSTVEHPHRAGPYFLLMPMNIQGALIHGFNTDELPHGSIPSLPAAGDDDAYDKAADLLLNARRVVIRAGGGARHAGAQLEELARLADGVVVTSPLASGVLPYRHPRNMTVGGSKGSLCGNFAMEEADLLVAVGTRSVCQSDSSRTNYGKAKAVIHINTELADAIHYNKTLPLVGEAEATLRLLNAALKKRLGGKVKAEGSPWLSDCTAAKRDWDAYKQERYEKGVLFDKKRGRELLTQPAAIKLAADWARANGVVSFYDAGDVQANGFQVVEDERPGQTFTDTGASYMGFATCALLATAATDKPFYAMAMTGDGSFMMNPQVLIDGVEHGAKGVILLMDNRCMAAIRGLQTAQYRHAFATEDGVEVDYVALAKAVTGIRALFGGYSRDELTRALDLAREHDGLSLIHLPVYLGDDPLGGLGAWGRWNVGNWCADVQALRHKIGL